jgi:glycosyltransferase involved in cell wall biosynthesis
MKLWLPSLRAGTGADVYAERLAAVLAGSGVDVRLQWFHRGYELLPELLRWKAVPSGTDLIHANSHYAHAFLGHGRPLVVTVHHVVHDPACQEFATPAQRLYHRWHLRWREQRAVDRAAAVVAVSGHAAASVRAVFGRTDTVVIPNWIDTDHFRPAIATGSSGRDRPAILLWVGNPSRRKGIADLPELARRLGPHVRIRCVGGLRGAQAGMAGVQWLGRLGEAELLNEYQSCDALLSTSRYEGFGYTALEAMACGKPVFGYAAGGLVDVVRDGIDGRLLPVAQLDALAEVLQASLGDPARLQAMGAAARLRAEQVFSPPRAAQAYLELYRRVSG